MLPATKLQLRTVAATRYVQAFREGGSVPALIEADDLGLYVVKLRGASQGVKTLVAELVVGELARAFGLRVPELVLVQLDAQIALHEPDPEIAHPLEASVGLNLGLDFLPGSVTFELGARRRQPLQALEASTIVLFDALMLNVDRTPRNPNLLLWHHAPWLIDHGAALYVHHAWDPNDPTDGLEEPFPEVSDHVLLPFATQLEAAAEALRTRFSPERVVTITQNLPDDWLHDPALERQAYVSWITRRMQALPRVLEAAQEAHAARV